MVAMRVLHAAEEGDLSVLQSLDDSILNETTVDEAGSNCLHYAARQGGVEVMAFLVSQKGFKGNVRSDVGATPAHDAAAAGNLQTLQWLLKNTACSVSDQDGIGATVLHLACRFHHTHVTEWLLENESCDVSKGTASGGIPLHFAVVGRDYNAVKMLVSENLTTVNLQTSNGATAVYLAAQEGAVDILRTLIQDHRGNIKIKSYDGMSCLHAAAQSGNLSCVQFLVEEEKFNPNERDFDGATPLHYAASQGHAHVIDWLLKVGGARVTLDNLGGSPLHNAAEMDCMECARTLINNGCDVTITDNNGLTASELARKCFNDDCALLIETYTAQSQTPIEPDVEYLLSAQSPRINLLRPYVTQYDGRQPPNTPSFLTKEPDPTIETGNQAYLNGYQPTSGPQTFTYKENRGINQADKEPSLKHKTKSVESIQAEADPEEFPVGVPRRVSQDFSVDSQSKQFENSPLSSSLSSLSQLDEVLEKASKEIEDREQSRRISTQGRRVNNPRFLSEKPGTSLNVKPYSNGSQFVNPDSTRNRNSQFAGGFSYLGAKVNEPKSVSFKTPSANTSYETVWLDDKSGRHNMESKGVHINVEGQENGDRMLDDVERLDLNGTNDMDGVNQGSVDDLDIISTNGHGRAQPLDNYHISRSEARSVLKMENRVHPDSNQQPLVNGNAPPTYLHAGAFPTPPPNPPQNINQNQNFNSKLSILKDEGLKSIIPNGMNGTDSNQGDSNNITEKLTNGTALFSVYEAENQPSLQAPPPPLVQGPPSPVQATPPLVQATPTPVQATPPLVQASAPPEQSPPISVLAPSPPPPLPPPPVPTANTQPQLDDGMKVNTEGLSPGLREEAKKKSVSLPARPASLLTAEMMQSKRSTLTPAPAKNLINASGGGANTDFISELKMATKGPALRKTSNAGGKPTMIFSSAAKESTSDDDKNKDAKVELVGEWDPKNFMDQVRNKDSLPAWKVQLQAKQIAEKTMKETQEKRAVEERESRFKNMPAWKRALVEKKEAEAKAAEEKRVQDEQQKVKVSTKKPLNVNITPKAKDGTSTLAPWQLELQQKD